MSLRRLGTYGANRATKKNGVVAPSDFSIAGLIGQFERKFDVAIEVGDMPQVNQIFGNRIDGFLGYDVAEGFFANVTGAKLWIKSFVGNDGSGTIDAVSASKSLLDTANPTLKIQAAWQDNVEYGISGLRTGFTITNGVRFATAFSETALSTATSAKLDSVSGIKKGDIIELKITGVAPATVQKKITSIDESLKTITWDGVLHATSTALVSDVVNVIGFQVKTFRKSKTGIVQEIETDRGKVWCSMEPEVTDFYAPNVHKFNNWIKCVDLNSASLLADSFPVDVTTETFLESGADGTTPTLPTHWKGELQSFNDKPVRFLTNCESTNSTTNTDGETYLSQRVDKPKWIYNILPDQNKTQLLKIGHSYQRSDDVLGVIVAHSYEITDPFVNSPIAPPRIIPSVGHTMGQWIRTIQSLGIHYIPAVASIPVIGITGIVGDQFLSDLDRTELAEAGINVTQFRQGIGFQIRNFFTPSTTKEFMFANGILMREYLKVSMVESLSKSENSPNSFNRIQNDRTAALNFLYLLWDRGSNGDTPRGETFGQTIKEDGSATNATDHFDVKADLTNNTQSGIEAGERNIDLAFTFPTPTGSIEIGVGFILLG